MASTSTPAKTTVKVALTNNAAKDDTFSSTDSKYSFLSENGSLKGNLDVLANDPGAATLYSVQTAPPVSTTAQMAKEAVGSTDKFFVTFEGQSYEGKLTLNADGTVGFDLSSLANATDANGGRLLDHMAQGESFTTTFWYTAKMANGTLSTSRVDVVITGANDGPTIAATTVACGTVQEDGTTLVQGHVDGKDVDHGAVLTYTGNATGTYGSFSVNSATGAWTYQLANGADNVQALAQGETQYETFTVTVSDEFGATATQTITVKVQGTNDAPTVEAALTGSADEDGASFGINLLTGAKDVDHGATLSVTNVSDLPDGVTLSGNTLTVDPSDASFQSLAVGETAEIVVSYNVTDEHGASVAQSVTITVTGTNDAPKVEAALTASANEDDAVFSVDLLAGASDVDHDAVLHVTDVSVLPDGVTLVGDTLSIDPSDVSFQSLKLGETTELVVSYNVTDEHGASVAQSVTITITGTNDAPTVEAALTASGNEDGAAFSINLLAGASDVDHDAVLHVTDVSALPEGVTLVDDTLSVDPSDTSFQSLKLGESTDIVVTYNVTDEHGASVAQSVTITVTGTNDAPTVEAALTASANEDDAVFSVDLLAGASDVDHDAVLHVTDVSALPDGVTLVGDTLSVDPSDVSFQSLKLGETTDLVVSYNVIDEHGASVAQSVTITVTGTNDAPTVEAALTASANEDDASFSVDLLSGASDVDHDAVLHVTDVSDLPAGVTLSGDTLSVDPSDPSFQSLSLGDTKDLVVSYNVTDEHGASAAQSVTITITGTNDKPTVSAEVTAAADEDSGNLVVDLLAGASDIDANDHLHVTNVSALPDGVLLLDDSLVVDTSDASFQSLAEGDTKDIVVTYEVSDGNGGTVEQKATVTITGTNDVASITGDTTGGVLVEDQITTVTGKVNVSDADHDQSFAEAGSGTGDFGSFSVDADGNWSYVLDNDSNAVQRLAIGETVQEKSFTIYSADHSAFVTLQFSVTGTNDAPKVTLSQTATATQYGLPATLNALAGATDVDHTDSLSVTFSSLPAGVTYNASTGLFMLDTFNQTYWHLPAGVSETITVNYGISDGTTTTPASVKFVITGVNDPGYSVNDESVAFDNQVTEAGGINNGNAGDPSASGKVIVRDVDDGEAKYQAPATLAGKYGNFQFDANTGVWSYTLDNSKATTQGLVAGAADVDLLRIKTYDGNSSEIFVVVNGANDTPTFGGTSTGAVTEDATTTTATGSLTINDVDTGQSAFQALTNQAGTYGSLTLGTNGAWTYTLDNANTATNALNNGDVKHDIFTVTSVDGTTTTIDVTVNGKTDSGDPNNFDSSGLPGVQNLTGGNGAQTLYGGAGDDIIDGGQGNDKLYGGSGNDNLLGGPLTGNPADNDTLYGGSGSDTINGGDGNDAIYGGDFGDNLTGGIGADTFYYLSSNDSSIFLPDTITDFVHGSDKIDLSAVYSGTLGFGGAAGSAFNVNVSELGGKTVIQIDTNGLQGSDMVINLTGTGLGLTASDFVL
ncbi:VCBS domain-containing protein [Novosphingobium cyanobacteriorum]|uniref:VCBS domain-containing protein n=1 Tax=Novosphingobium cyanobacteriorum TaxID=3024215 RepID=A0ABT6CH89_9SPHN|nr:VCBS domain-containing protein [Novosphingobium cyanobacteriorum]MDF8333296.1 VCBS domain-containing protein [Novosphingobium cyanobacteriorum]